MITFAAIVFLLSIASQILSYLTKKSIASVLPVSIFVLILWLFAFGIFNHLPVGVFSIFPLTVFYFCYLVFTKKISLRKSFLKEFLSPGYLFFIAASAFTFLNSQRMRFSEWDEFSHWGPAVKSLFLFNKLGPSSPAELVFPDYPPGLSLFSYFVVRLGSTWDEADVFWSYQLIAITIIASIVSMTSWKHKQVTMISLIIGLLASVFYFNTFQTIYADPILGMIFGLSLVIAAEKKSKSTLFLLILVTSVLSLIKDTGFIFAIISIFVFLIRNSHHELIKFKKIKLPENLITITLLMLPIFLIRMTWVYYLNANNVTPGRDVANVITSISSGNFDALIKPYSRDVTVAFFERCIDNPLSQINGLPISPLKWIIIFSFVLGTFVVNSNLKNDRKLEIKTSLGIILGFIFYLVVLLFLYLTVFTEGEARGLASFERYVSTYFAGVVIYISAKTIQNLVSLQKNMESQLSSKSITILDRSIVAWMLVLLIQGSPWHILSYTSNPNGASSQIESKYSYENSLIEKMNLQTKDRVWIIAQHTVGFEFYMFQYKILPASVGRSPWSIGSYYGPGDIWTDSSITPAIWEDKLRNFNYVFVYSVTDSFVKEFGRLFESNNDFTKPAFYLVDKGTDRVILKKVG